MTPNIYTSTHMCMFTHMNKCVHTHKDLKTHIYWYSHIYMCTPNSIYPCTQSTCLCVSINAHPHTPVGKPTLVDWHPKFSHLPSL